MAYSVSVSGSMANFDSTFETDSDEKDQLIPIEETFSFDRDLYYKHIRQKDNNDFLKICYNVLSTCFQFEILSFFLPENKLCDSSMFFFLIA